MRDAGCGTRRAMQTATAPRVHLASRRPTAPASHAPPPAPRERPALRFAALLHRRENLGAALSPWIELVRREAVLPRFRCLVALPVETERSPQLEVRLDQPGAERDRLPEERLCILEHVALEVHQAKIEVRVQRSLLVVVEANRARQVL